MPELLSLRDRYSHTLLEFLRKCYLPPPPKEEPSKADGKKMRRGEGYSFNTPLEYFYPLYHGEEAHIVLQRSYWE